MTRINLHSVFLSLVMLLATTTSAFAKDYSNALIPKKERLDVVCMLHDTVAPHAKHSMLINSYEDNDQWYYEFTAHGEGTYDTFRDVRWTKKSQVIDANGILKPLRSVINVYNQDESLNTRYTIEYDYRENRVHFYTDGPEYSKPRHHSFTIKGPICDDVTMIHFLKTYAANVGRPGYEHFYLVTNEPNVYKVNIVEKAREVLDLPIGRINTVKIQAYASMGPLTQVMKAILPATYLWYEDQYPYHWVQYQGLDGGPHSENIKAVVVDRE